MEAVPNIARSPHIYLGFFVLGQESGFPNVNQIYVFFPGLVASSSRVFFHTSPILWRNVEIERSTLTLPPVQWVRKAGKTPSRRSSRPWFAFEANPVSKCG